MGYVCETVIVRVRGVIEIYDLRVVDGKQDGERNDQNKNRLKQDRNEP